jgi:broad specificity phosphatase PhoE
MAKAYVIQAGRTIWDEQARVESALGAPLSPAGVQEVQDAARQLLAIQAGIEVIYASAGAAEQQSAECLAGVLGAKIRIRKDLCELDYGLWQGLTQEEMKRRQPRLFRQWMEAPASVRPPGGETIEEASSRLKKALKDVLKRHKNGQALLVLRPVALGLVRCLVRRQGVDQLWQNVQAACQWELLEADNGLLSGR